MKLFNWVKVGMDFATAASATPIVITVSGFIFV